MTEYSYTVKLKRGDGADVQKVTVEAATIEELEDRVDAVRERLRGRLECIVSRSAVYRFER